MGYRKGRHHIDYDEPNFGSPKREKEDLSTTALALLSFARATDVPIKAIKIPSKVLYDIILEDSTTNVTTINVTQLQELLPLLQKMCTQIRLSEFPNSSKLKLITVDLDEIPKACASEEYSSDGMIEGSDDDLSVCDMIQTEQPKNIRNTLGSKRKENPVWKEEKRVQHKRVCPPSKAPPPPRLRPVKSSLPHHEDSEICSSPVTPVPNPTPPSLLAAPQLIIPNPSFHPQYSQEMAAQQFQCSPPAYQPQTEEEVMYMYMQQYAAQRPDLLPGWQYPIHEMAPHCHREQSPEHAQNPSSRDRLEANRTLINKLQERIRGYRDYRSDSHEHDVPPAMPAPDFSQPPPQFCHPSFESQYPPPHMIYTQPPPSYTYPSEAIEQSLSDRAAHALHENAEYHPSHILPPAMRKSRAAFGTDRYSDEDSGYRGGSSSSRKRKSRSSRQARKRYGKMSDTEDHSDSSPDDMWDAACRA